MRPCARHGIATLASLVTALAVTGAAVATDGTTTPAPPPCVAAGIVAVFQPGAAAATTVGPALAVAARTGDELPTFTDTTYGVDLADVQVGAEGCVSGEVPGGASARAGAWSVLGGVVAGTSLRADLVPAKGDGSGWHLRTKLIGLSVDGSAADPIAGASIAVSDWGVLDVHATFDAKAVQPLRYWAAALDLRLTRAHAGLPAGTRVLIGYVGSDREYAPPPAPPAAPKTTVTTTTTASTTTTTTTASAPPPPTTTTNAAPVHGTQSVHRAPTKHVAASKPKQKPKRTHKPLTGRPLKGTPSLGAGDYVFPIDGHSDWGDTYGAERSDVPGGWHHGDDLFAPLGTPVVAVTDGTVFSVGWNKVGGWRLWLLDANGNQFYYCHLSGYTALGSNDAHVKRGQVLGFVGNTGDAVTTWPHLHFEVHPSSTLYLGYDGAVDPSSYLRNWGLAHNVVVPPPVELPSKAPPGRGSTVDFRRLLAVHPLHKHVKAPLVTASPRYYPHGVERGPVEGERVAAAAPLRPRTGGGGNAAILAGVLLAFAALVALLYTARLGRST